MYSAQIIKLHPLLAAAVTVVFTMMTMGYARETARRAGNEGGGWLIHGCLTFQEKFVGVLCGMHHQRVDYPSVSLHAPEVQDPDADRGSVPSVGTTPR